MTGTERKVFQKYYPPDFDPSKLPKAKGQRNRQFVQRVMAPYNMQCNTCHEYIYKGKKFNMRRETVEGESYLGLRLFRFYFRCPNCIAEISFKTDLENCDYQQEHGATRLFDAFKHYQEQAKKEEEAEEAEKADAMKMLEKRTKMSKREMQDMGELEEIEELNRRNERIDARDFLLDDDERRAAFMAQIREMQDEEDEAIIQELREKTATTTTEDGKIIKRLQDDEDDAEAERMRRQKQLAAMKEEASSSQPKKTFGSLAGLKLGVKRKLDVNGGPSSSNGASASSSLAADPVPTQTIQVKPVVPAVNLAVPTPAQPVAAAATKKPALSTLIAGYGSSSDSD